MYIPITAALTSLLALAAATPLADSTTRLQPRSTPMPKIYKPSGTNRLGVCDRRDGEKCWYIDNVSGKKGNSPCVKFDTGGSANMGLWPSVDVNCTMFENRDCQYTIGGVEQENLPLNGWGIDKFNTDKWKAEGFQGKAKGWGPQSVFCWLRDHTVGLGQVSNKCGKTDNGCIIRSSNA